MTNTLTISRELESIIQRHYRQRTSKDELIDDLRALLANHTEEPLGVAEPVAYRYKEGHATWENEKPWEPTTLKHAAVLLDRKALAANGSFKGDSQAYYLALTVEPLYTSPPAPVAVDERAEFENYYRDRIMGNRTGVRFLRSATGSYLDRKVLEMWSGWQARACLDKVKEMNR